MTKLTGTYYNKEEFTYHSERYNKDVTVPLNYKSDGATGAFDINSKAWWVHDVLCEFGVFDDGTACNNKQASQILSDILKSEGHYIRSVTWFFATYLFGGGKARDNGMW